jgi:hypothetical protein
MLLPPTSQQATTALDQVTNLCLCADYVFYNANRTINQPFKTVMAVMTGDPACTAK